MKTSQNSPFDFSGSFTMEAWICPLAWASDSYNGGNFVMFSRWKHGISTLYLFAVD